MRLRMFFSTERKYLYRTGLSALLLLMTSSCASGPDYDSERFERVDWDRLPNFILVPIPETLGSGVTREQIRTSGFVRAGVIMAMLNKGFTETKLGEADLFINMRGNVLPTYDLTSWNLQRAPSLNTPEKTKTIIIEVYNRRTGVALWAGQASWDVPQEDMSEDEFIRYLTQEIMDDFPGDVD